MARLLAEQRQHDVPQRAMIEEPAAAAKSAAQSAATAVPAAPASVPAKTFVTMPLVPMTLVAAIVMTASAAALAATHQPAASAVIDLAPSVFVKSHSHDFLQVGFDTSIRYI